MDGHTLFGVVDTGAACTNHEYKYWMPIHYDTFEDGIMKMFRQ